MTVKRPPAIAFWMLVHFSDAAEGLIGDLSEEHQRRGSSFWYRRQVAIAIVVGFIRGVLNNKLETLQAVFTGFAAMIVGGLLVREPLLRMFSSLAGSSLPLPPWRWNNIYMLVSAVVWFAIAIATGLLLKRLHPARRATMTFALLLFLAAFNMPEWYRLARNAWTTGPHFAPYLANSVAYFLITSIGLALGSLWNRGASHSPSPRVQM